MLRIDLNQAVSKDLIEKVNKAPQLFNEAVGIGLLRIGNIMRNRAGGLAPHKTGNLRRSITVEAGSKEVRVGTNLVYARIQDLGGGIKPKYKKALRFKVGGQWVTTRQVTIRGNRYLTSTFENMKNGKALGIIGEEINAKFK